jgi:hypothetical protein
MHGAGAAAGQQLPDLWVFPRLQRAEVFARGFIGEEGI